MVLPFLFPRYIDSVIRGSGKGEEPSGGSALRLIQIRLTAQSVDKIEPLCQVTKPTEWRDAAMPV